MSRQFVAFSGLAMVLIVLNHSIQMSMEAAVAAGYALPGGVGRFLLTVLQALGVFAVPIFLFISGAFVAYAAKGAPRLSTKFVWKSIRHILWPYLVWSIVFYILIYFHGGQRFSAAGYLKNLATGFPFHFVPLLILFYVASPALIPAARRHPWLLLGVIGGYQLLLIAIRQPDVFSISLPAPVRLLNPPIVGGTFSDWGIFFPLGTVFSLHASSLKTRLERVKWISVLATLALFVLGLLHATDVVSAPWARFIVPLPLLLVVPVVQRRSIPAVQQLEKVGKRSYGLYLTHLIVIDLLLWAIELLARPLLAYQYVLFPLLFVVGLALPVIIMSDVAQRRPTRKVYRYVFG
ncbi:MAG: acyltransferase [Candidatus Promineifilaceae bacterium]|nr:acyltransferase [Candidatus Promineifilaceae bacterium]